MTDEIEKPAIRIRHPYDGIRHRVAVPPGGPSRTKQSFKDECDVNNIMRKYQQTGLLNHVNRFRGDYADYTGVQDYQASLNQVLAANEAFSSLPSKLRARFGNDPALFLDFVGDPDNRDEMERLGLLRTPQSASEAPPASPLPDDSSPPLQEAPPPVPPAKKPAR